MYNYICTLICVDVFFFERNSHISVASLFYYTSFAISRGKWRLRGHAYVGQLFWSPIRFSSQTLVAAAVIATPLCSHPSLLLLCPPTTPPLLRLAPSRSSRSVSQSASRRERSSGFFQWGGCKTAGGSGERDNWRPKGTNRRSKECRAIGGGRWVKTRTTGWTPVTASMDWVKGEGDQKRYKTKTDREGVSAREKQQEWRVWMSWSWSGGSRWSS